LSIFSDQSLGWSMWVASILAALGIALIQWTGRDRPRNALLTMLQAFLMTIAIIAPFE